MNCYPRILLTKEFLPFSIEALIFKREVHEKIVLHVTPLTSEKYNTKVFAFTKKGYWHIIAEEKCNHPFTCYNSFDTSNPLMLNELTGPQPTMQVLGESLDGGKVRRVLRITLL